MNREQLARRILELVTAIAPDVEAGTVIPGIAFRDQFDFDSMDTLNFAIALHREFGVDVPETDYAHLASLDQCVAYLAERLPMRPETVGGQRSCPEHCAWIAKHNESDRHSAYD